ncbi:hypothetical protein [Paenibacillus illinoisensis]|uniref:Uncharacterized protein n=1 Tax=Paenibacillus illinoisensis TaxID=59845 RepID=A0A2W0C760_9BACL|nr:hypothetical protein [Paenibacillus illinoisensis]PYY28266.1 hypothetical protein PIL02S_03412 [Paenibacillus illinoisensis]
MKTVSFINRGKDEEIEFYYDSKHGFGVSLMNGWGDSSCVSKLTMEDMMNIKKAIDEVIQASCLG